MCVYIYIYICYSAIKKEWNIAICSNMDGSREYHTKWSKSERDKCYMISLTCVIWKIIQMNVYTKRNRLTDIENKLMVTKGEREGARGIN